jgi:hypothetical protein
MKRNPETGLYEAYKLIKATGEELVGLGESKAAAKEDLKKKLEEYRKRPPVVMASKFNSPGYEVTQVNGAMTYRKNEKRSGAIWTRPDLADFVRELSKEDE